MGPVKVKKETLRDDAVAGIVLGVASVPDGLATGLLAGVNPIAGLNAYLVGTPVGALATSSSFMAIQGTGAMAMIVADVPAVHAAADPARALFTLSVLTGVVMLIAGLLRLGSILRFVSNAVMVGFINAVGVNIILGQLADFTGYAAQGANRVTRALDTLLHPAEIHLETLAVGVATIALIIVLERTRLKALGLVVAIFVALRLSAGARPGWRGHAQRHRRHPQRAASARAPGAGARTGAHRTGALTWRSSGWSRARASLPTTPIPTAATRTRHGTSWGRARPTSRPASSRGCPSVARCRRRRSTRPPARDPETRCSSRER